MDAPPIIRPAIALSEAQERDAYPHPGRRLTKYEPIATKTREKPLPQIPVQVAVPTHSRTAHSVAPPLLVAMPTQTHLARRKSIERVLSHRRGQSYTQRHSLSQSPAALLATSSPHCPWILSTPSLSKSTHTPATAAASFTHAPMRSVKRAASFSALVAPPPGASRHRSSKKVSQIIGHDLDLPQDPYGLQYDSTNYTLANDDFEQDSATSSGASNCPSASDLEHHAGQSYLDTEQDLLVLARLEQDGHYLPGRQSPWVPRTPGEDAILPSPINNRRLAHSPTVRLKPFANSETILLHESGANFSLGSSRPAMRWDPSYGQFTDKRAATDYHRFASQLATSPRQRRTMCHPASRETNANRHPPSGQPRLPDTTAVYHFWDGPLSQGDTKVAMATPTLPLPPPLPPLPPTTTTEHVHVATAMTCMPRNKLKKHRPSRQLAIELQPAPTAPQPNTCSAFDCDSDEDTGPGLVRWWRRSDEGGRRSDEGEHLSSAEWSAFHSGHSRRHHDDDRDKPALGSGVKGLLANARERALLSPAERRRADLRKSIKVLRAPDL